MGYAVTQVNNRLTTTTNQLSTEACGVRFAAALAINSTHAAAALGGSARRPRVSAPLNSVSLRSCIAAAFFAPPFNPHRRRRSPRTGGCRPSARFGGSAIRLVSPPTLVSILASGLSMPLGSRRRLKMFRACPSSVLLGRSRPLRFRSPSLAAPVGLRRTVCIVFVAPFARLRRGRFVAVSSLLARSPCRFRSLFAPVRAAARALRRPSHCSVGALLALWACRALALRPLRFSRASPRPSASRPPCPSA